MKTVSTPAARSEPASHAPRAPRAVARLMPLLALAGLACMTLSYWAEPAAAKSMTCYAKVAACNDRCTVRYRDNGDAAITRCNKGTCLHQLKNCLSNAAGGPVRPAEGKGPTGAGSGPIVRDKRGQPPRRPIPTGSISQPAVQPRPVTAASSQPAVRDHRGTSRGSPFGIGGIKSVNDR